MAVCCVLFRISETISFAVSFPIAIVEGDCQLIYGLEGCDFEPILRYTGEVGQREIDFFFIGGELRRVGAEEESALE